MGDNNNKLGFVGEKIQYTSLKSINMYKSESINPAKYPNEIFEVYSVPAFETGHPEYLHGEEIASNKNIVQKDDILLCKINPRINRVWVVADESEHQNIASSEWIVIRTKEYNPEFLAWYLRTPKFQQLMTSEVTGIGGSLTRAQPKRVAEYPVPVVDREMQERITNVLNHVSHMVQLKKQELRQLDTLIKARFVELFGEPEHNTKGLPTDTLGNLCSVGSSKRIYKSEQTMEGIPFLRISDLVNLIDSGTLKSDLNISEERYSELVYQGQVPVAGDILVTSRGTLGRCYIVGSDDRFYFQDGMISWLSNLSSSITPLYVSFLFSMEGFRKQIDKMQAGSTVSYLSITMLKKLEIMIPSSELQELFAAFVAQVDKSKVAVQKSLDELQILFDSLMQEYFG